MQEHVADHTFQNRSTCNDFIKCFREPKATSMWTRPSSSPSSTSAPDVPECISFRNCCHLKLSSWSSWSLLEPFELATSSSSGQLLYMWKTFLFWNDGYPCRIWLPLADKEFLSSPAQSKLGKICKATKNEVLTNGMEKRFQHFEKIITAWHIIQNIIPVLCFRIKTKLRISE